MELLRNELDIYHDVQHAQDDDTARKGGDCAA